MRGTDLDWTLLAWNGVGFEMPADWSLAAATGDRKKGLLRVEDEYLTRAEVVWQPVHRHRTVDDIVAAARRQFLKNARKRGERLVVEPADGPKLKRRDYRLLRCRPEDSVGDSVESLNLVTRCESCRRAVLVSVFGRRSERRGITETARRLFDALYDHSDGRTDVWSAFGVRLEVPADYELTRSALRVGLVDLSFARKDWQIDLIRSALAEVQIGRQGLGQWFVGAYARRLRSYTTTTERLEFRGHAALDVRGATSTAKALLRPLRPREHLFCRTWHCQNTDKLLIFRQSGPRAAKEEFERLLAKVVCH
jgi:hypothetical protein